jgi:hypothetical protein
MGKLEGKVASMSARVLAVTVDTDARPLVFYRGRYRDVAE